MADKTIPDLTAAASVAGTDLIEISDGSPSSKKATIAQVQSAVTSGFVPSSRTISTTAPLAGGGDLSANRTFSIADASADGATKGAAAFLAADFTSAAGVIGIDYVNGQKATTLIPGFLAAADWTTFNSKQAALGFTPPPNTRLISTTSPLAGGGDLSADRTLSIADAAADGVTKGASTFTAADFNAAAGVISIDYTNGQSSSAVNKGFLTSADWTTFNSKASTEAPFADTTAIVKGSADATKLLRFEVDGFTTGTTRIATPPNQNFTMAGIDVIQTFSAAQAFTPAANTVAININAVSVTGASSQVFSRIVGTWNTSGTPSAFLIGITDTASNAASKLIELQVGGGEVFSVGKTGALNFLDGVRQTFNPDATNAGINVGSHAADPGTLVNGDLWYESTANELHARINGATVALGAGGGSAPFADTTAIVKGSADATKLLRFEVDGLTTGTTRVATPPNQDFTIAGINVQQTFTQRQTITPPVDTAALIVSGYSQTGSAASNLIDLSGTWNTTGAPTGIKLNIINTASDATALLMDLQASSGSRFSVDINGFATVGDGLLVGGTFSIGSVFSVNGSTGLATWADGVRQTFNPNGTNAGINVGANAADPSATVNGDLWYQSTANELRARINGATVALGSGGGASPPFDDGTAIIKGSADATKLLRIEVDGFTTATTRVATPPNQDFTMAGTNVAQTFTVEQTFTPAANTEAITVTGFSLTGANTQSVLDLSGTWNTTGQPSAIKLNITDTASVSPSFLLDLRVGNVQKFYINKDGSFTSSGFGTLADGSFTAAGGDFSVEADGSFIASAMLFSVDASGNAQVFNTLTFGESGNTIFDDTGLLTLPAANSRVGSAPFYDSAGFFGVNSLQISSGIELTNEAGDLRLSGSIYFGVNAVGAIGIVADAYIQVIDGTGASYKILCVAV